MIVSEHKPEQLKLPLYPRIQEELLKRKKKEEEDSIENAIILSILEGEGAENDDEETDEKPV